MRLGHIHEYLKHIHETHDTKWLTKSYGQVDAKKFGVLQRHSFIARTCFHTDTQDASWLSPRFSFRIPDRFKIECLHVGRNLEVSVTFRENEEAFVNELRNARIWIFFF